ncbi:hypothetical protein ScPMuIL_004539 [Solemya velum]
MMEHTYMKLSQQSVRIQDIEEKWMTIFNERQREAIYTPDQYKNNLTSLLQDLRHGGHDANSVHRMIEPISYILRKLKLDMKMSYDSFVEEFLTKPDGGITLLLTLLREVHAVRKLLIGSSTKSDVINFKKTLTEEHDCLFCIKYTLRMQKAVDLLLEDTNGLETIAMCIVSSYTKSRAIAIEILTLILTINIKSFERVLGAFTYLRLKLSESVHFKFLVGMLMSQNSGNGLFQCTTTDGLLYRERRKEIEEWKKQYIDVDRLLEDNKSYTIKITNMKYQIEELKKKITILEERNSSLGKLNGYTGVQGSIRMRTEAKPRPDVRKTKRTRVPPAPQVSSKTLLHRHYQGPTSEHRLPLFDWTPLPTIKNTIFEDVDDGDVYHKVDLNHFEKCFKLGPRDLPADTMRRREKLHRPRSQSVILGIGDNAKILGIAHTKIRLSPLELMAAINEYDINKLSCGEINLLIPFLNFLTEKQKQKMTSLRGMYSEMTDIDKTIYELAHIDRLGEKIKLMEFMSGFSDAAYRLKTSMIKIKRASTSLFVSKQFQEVLEIILAIGNFLNHDRRHPINGFHLSSLCKLKGVSSQRRDQTLLQYIVYIIQMYYPGLQNWYDGIDDASPLPGSYSRIKFEMRDIKSGMALLETERKLEPTCRRLDEFFYHSFKECRELNSQFAETTKAYADACQLFGVQLSLEPRTLFGYIRAFINDFKKAANEGTYSENHSSSAHTDSSELTVTVTDIDTLHRSSIVDNEDINNRITDIFAGIYESDTCTSPNDNSTHDDDFLDPYGIVITPEDRRKHLQRDKIRSEQNWFVARRSDMVDIWQNDHTESKASLEVPRTSKDVLDTSEKIVMSRYLQESNALYTDKSNNGEKSSESSDSAFGEQNAKHRKYPDRTTGTVTYINVSDVHTRPTDLRPDRSRGITSLRPDRSRDYTEPKTDYSCDDSPYSTIKDPSQYENLPTTLPTFYI